MELFQSTVVSRVTGAWELKNDLERLRDSLPHVNHLMEKAEWWRFKRPYIGDLLKQLRQTTYDAEEVIAMFDYYQLKQRIEGQNKHPIWSLVSSFLKNLVTNYASKVKEVQSKLDSISGKLDNETRLLGLPDAGTNPYGKAVQHETSSFLPELVLGRDDEVEKAVKLMLQPCVEVGSINEGSSSSSNPAKRRRKTAGNLSILPIVGMGGMGKTTLAQLIYNDGRVKSHFDLRIWVCVSDYFDLKKITKEMIESAHGELTANGDLQNFDKQIGIGENLTNLNSLQQKLQEKVASRRYFLVLDDVWHDNTRDWDSLLNPLRSGLEGSMILVTTRMSVVADIVGTLDPIKVENLPPDIYWDLFKKCAFGSSDPSSFPELESIARKIATRLKGSPLAAKTLGGILHANMTIEQWRNILNSELWQIEQADGDILPALRVSYQYLPVKLKRCFQTFSLFPKDFRLSLTELDRVWVSDGIINGGDEMGPKYFQDFVNRSFLITHKNGKKYLHDLMHDLSKSLSGGTYHCIEDNNLNLENHNSVRHLSVYRNSIELIDKEIGRCKNLRSLIFLPEYRFHTRMSSSILASWFDELVYLRFLHLEYCQIEELPENIGNLKLLIYINLRDSKIKSLPDSICQLYNLRVIYVEDCPLESFPKKFHNLINLRLITVVTEISTKIFSIGKLTSLKALGEFKVLKEDGHKIEELKNLNRLQGELKISNLENVEGREDAARACLNKKEHVTRLDLSWSHGRITSSGNGDTLIDEDTIEGLQPHSNLEDLSINNYGGGAPPSWLQSEMLPCLKHLYIKGCFNLQSLDDWFMSCRVPPLLTFHIEECANLLSLPLEWINNSSITGLTVSNCPQLSSSNNLMLPSSLKNLYLDSCGQFDMSLQGCLQNVNSLNWLELRNCQHVTSLPSHVTHHMKYLILENCAELQRLEVCNASILMVLEITRCPQLIQSDRSCSHSEAPLDRIHHLNDLVIDNTSLLKLHFLRNPSRSLQRLIISNSPEKKLFTGEVQSWLNRIENLDYLTIDKCYNLESLPEELYTVTLKSMVVRDCPKIQSLPVNGLPPSLTSLEFDRCHPSLTEQLEQQKKAIEERQRNLQQR